MSYWSQSSSQLDVVFVSPAKEDTFTAGLTYQ